MTNIKSNPKFMFGMASSVQCGENGRKRRRGFLWPVALAIPLSLLDVNAQLVNVQFGDPANPYIKTGTEAVGFSSSDHWNFVSADKGGGAYSLYGAADYGNHSTSVNIYSDGENSQTFTSY